MSGDFDTQVDHALLHWPSNNGVRTGTGLDLLFMAGVRGSFSPADYVGVSGDYYLTRFIDGVEGLTATADHGKLRGTRVGDLLSGYYWNSQAWVLIRQGAGTSGAGNVRVVVWWSGQVFRDQSVKVAFEKSTVTASGFEPELVPTPVPFAVRLIRHRGR